ncbi:MAG: hypothetical protein AB7O32_07695 [Vicinamibacterales bacterium]
MRVVNRTAVTLVPAQPFIDWTLARDAAFSPGAVTVVRTKPFGTAYLLPEFDDESEVQEWIEENYGWLFEFQLSTWTEDETAWPAVRDLKTFRTWFRVDVHTTVVDIGDDDIEGEEL